MKISKINSQIQFGKSSILLAVDEKDQSKSLSIHSHIVIDFLVSANNYTHNPCLRANTANNSIHNSAMNSGGAA